MYVGCFQAFYYPRDVVSVVYATEMWLADWVSACHMPVLYQNG